MVGGCGRRRSRGGRRAGGRRGGGACRRPPRRRSPETRSSRTRCGLGVIQPSTRRRARSRSTARMSKKQQRGEREALGHRDGDAGPPWRTAKTSPCSVAMWTCSTGSPPARSATASRARGVLAPALGVPGGGEEPRRRSRGSRPRAGRATSPRGRRAPARRPRRETLPRCRSVGHLAKIPTRVPGASFVDHRRRRSARSPWSSFAISGYTGYSITVGAVGLAAAVNLLPLLP